ncbi:hypothetical protein DICPUDRAFT_81702 [Dictyostelium purpureum]|uniref:N-acetyltransferase domain-containing protein n=1 Tax=Dictyostelium purpureum TaxID=5786 RepID=F0ZUB7_DICPU|nr:uncharacterized protein DICPUDRAFT_81702 [Dictyostelium purpureum]EGC32470.1 hypothetical protein DICPUDRAFT_81702 [Dictyostelium purpureum]|eukprot:XP_003291004.1 hypothetical protein DICPUDRAFT_81702 [Dictyostelium purpureum]
MEKRGEYIVEKLKELDYNKANELVKVAFSNAEHSDHDEHNLIQRLRGEELYNNDFEIVVKDKNDNNKIVGYALLSEIKICKNESTPPFKAVCLAPIAVLPSHQKQGIGKLLMKEIEEIATKYRYPAISILGSPNYYSKFGYVPSSNFNINATFDVPKEYYMIKPLFDNSLSNIEGLVYYQKSFGI